VSLFDLLACPVCHTPVDRQLDSLMCTRCGQAYPIVNGVPVMFPGGDAPAIEHEAELVTYGEYYPWYHRLIMQSLLDNQVVLNIGSGNVTIDDPCVIRMDVKLTPYVDIVADAHALPFLPESIDFMFSLAVVEHLRNPFQAAESMYRALKDGGYAFHDCNFVFAYHGYPHHYFNASLQGMESAFSDFRVLRRGVAPYQMPSFSIESLVSTYLRHTKAHETEEGRQWCRVLEGVMEQNSMWYDKYFDEADALYVAAGTSVCWVKQETSESTVIPEVIMDKWRSAPELQKRFPDPVDLTHVDNLLVWARSEGASYSEIKAYLDELDRFHKHGPGEPWDRSYVKGTPLEQPKFGAHPHAEPPRPVMAPPKRPLMRRIAAAGKLLIQG
jgi:uncharacterized protein YbaR (Trm112 family)/SAM-dependent methyltransferase